VELLSVYRSAKVSIVDQRMSDEYGPYLLTLLVQLDKVPKIRVTFSHLGSPRPE